MELCLYQFTIYELDYYELSIIISVGYVDDSNIIIDLFMTIVAFTPTTWTWILMQPRVGFL
jgi:hypothetical protein